MTIELSRPLCFFDLETTGVDISKDRIVEMATIKLHPNGTKEERLWLINPEQPIPAEATAIHGITNEMVANSPTFKEESHKKKDFIEGEFKDIEEEDEVLVRVQKLSLIHI